MKKFKFLAIIGILCICFITLFSCNVNTDNNANEESVELTRRELLTHYAITGDYKLTEDEVVESLESFLTSGPSSEGLVSKSGEKNYSLKKADTIIYKFNKPSIATNILYSKGDSGEETSDDVNLFVYDINNEDGNGYAILCDDLRIGDVICIADGEYRFGDSDNLLAQYLEDQLNDYIETTRTIWEDLNENDVEILKNKCGITDEDIQETIQQNLVSKAEKTIGKWKVDQINGKSILKTKWGQSSFYNDAIEAVYKKKYITGCSAVATAQLMAFHKKPSIMSSPNGRTRFYRLKASWPKIPSSWGGVYDWDVIYDATTVTAKEKNLFNLIRRISSRKYQIPALMYEVAEGINARYSDGGGTSSNLFNCVDYLRSIGYECDYVAAYNFDKVKMSIDRGLPVLARGQEDDDSEVGHAWVMDGYKKYYRDKKLYVRSSGSCKTITTKEYQNYVHCNFGWEGDDDGYYISEIFGSYKRGLLIAANARYK